MEGNNQKINKGGFPIHVIGISASGVSDLSQKLQNIILSTKKLAGPSRLLTSLNDWWARKRSKNTLPEFFESDKPVDLINWLKKQDQQVVLLASGDPLCYGIAAKLLKHVPISEICIKPSLSTFSLICSRIGWSLPDVETLTIHGRPLEMIHPFVQCGAKLLVLSKDEDSPKNVAKLLSFRGFGKSIITVFEHLDGKNERQYSNRKWICSKYT